MPTEWSLVGGSQILCGSYTICLTESRGIIIWDHDRICQMSGSRHVRNWGKCMPLPCSSVFQCVLSSCFDPSCSISSRGDTTGGQITGSCVHFPCIECGLLNFFRSSSCHSTLPQSSLRGRSLHNSSCKPLFFSPPRVLKTSFQNVSC